MYYAFFGLTQPPFKITPDTDFFFEGGNRGAVLEALIYAITQGEGIVKVTGEVGSGKTTLGRAGSASRSADSRGSEHRALIHRPDGFGRFENESFRLSIDLSWF